MTDPNETNEEVNEELSTDELKSVSGGWSQPKEEDCPLYVGNIYPSGVKRRSPIDPQGSGSGKTTEDWMKSKEGKAWTGPEQVH